MSTHVLNLQFQLMLSSSISPLLSLAERALHQARGVSKRKYLESKVLEEVSSAICFVCFRSAASVDPHTHGRRLSPGRILCGNL